MKKLWLSTTLPGPTPCAIVDDQDFEALTAFNWFSCRSADGTRRYALRRGPRPRRQVIMLHRQIMGVEDEPNTVQVVFRNGNGLDCRRLNLVVATAAHRTVAKARKATKSGFRGVQLANETQTVAREQLAANMAKHGLPPLTRAPVRRRWNAVMIVGGRMKHLGAFDTPEEAAMVYDREALRLYGDVVRKGLNFPDLVQGGGAPPNT